MLPIVWMLLKIILLVILCLLGLLLIVLAALLFVPVGYRIRAEKQETVWCSGRLSWLFPIVVFSFGYRDDAYAVLRIFGIPVYDKSREKKPQKTRETKDRKKKGKKGGTIPEDEHTEYRKASGQQNETESGTKTLVKLEKETESLPEKTIEKKAEEEAKKPGIPEKLRRFWGALKAVLKRLWGQLQNIRYTISAFCDRIKDIVGKVDYVRETLTREETCRAFLQCKEQLLFVWKNIRPGRLSIKLHAGFEDPAVMGEVLSVYGMLYPWLYPYVSIEPEFEKEILEGSFFCRGHVTVFVLLRAAWRLYFDKDIRFLWKLVKKEEAENG